MHAQGGLAIPDTTHIGQPYWYKDGGTDSPDRHGLKMAHELEQKVNELGEARGAAFIAEPLQGAGGVVIPPETYWPEISDICRRYQILLVADEVICGFGRTGKWFGSDYYNIQPDLMSIAKGLSSGYLPIAAVMVADHVSRVLIEEGGEFFHGMTYSGHPAACAVACANVRILRDENIIDRVDTVTGPYLQERWNALADHPLVGESRGIGFLGALELVEDKDTRKPYDPGREIGTLCREACLRLGLVLRAVGDTMIISPPLIMSEAEIDEMIAKVVQGLDETFGSITN